MKLKNILLNNLETVNFKIGIFVYEIVHKNSSRN